MPTTFVPHGGGAWPVLDLPQMDADEAVALRSFMRSIAQVPPTKPSALLVVSAHWEEPTFAVNTAPAPGMLYDYGGFPEEAYRLKWPAPGHPALAAQVRRLLDAAHLQTSANAERGYDHGTFIPLMLAYPEADVPIVQLSLRKDLDPKAHLEAGKALAPLRDEGVFIIGSGNSFHNLPAFFRKDHQLLPQAQLFDAWLDEVVTHPVEARNDHLSQWLEVPGARECHPREEHLLPLMVAAGAGEADPGRVTWKGATNGFPVSAHVFG